MTAAYVDKPPAAQAAVDLADILAAENRNDDAEQMLALAEKTFETALGPTSISPSGSPSAPRHDSETTRPRPPPPAPRPTVYRVGGTPKSRRPASCRIQNRAAIFRGSAEKQAARLHPAEHGDRRHRNAHPDRRPAPPRHGPGRKSHRSRFPVEIHSGTKERSPGPSLQPSRNDLPPALGHNLRRRATPAAIPNPPISIIAHDEGSGVDEPVPVSRTPDDEVKETPLMEEMLSAAVWLKSHVSPSPQETSSHALRLSVLIPAGTANTPVNVSVVVLAPVTDVLTQPVGW